VRTPFVSHPIDRCNIPTSDPPGIAPRRWFNFIPASSVDARTTHRKPDGEPITVRERYMLLLLEGYCRTKCYTWVSNRELAAAYGCSERTLQQLLEAMEADNLIRRVLDDRGTEDRREVWRRTGIVLLKRLNDDLPVAEPGEVPDIATRMEDDKADHQGRRQATHTRDFGAGETAPSRARETAPSRARETAPSQGEENRARMNTKSLSLEEDETEDDAGEGSVERQRPEGPPARVPPVPPAAAPDPVAAPVVPIAAPVANGPVLVAVLAATFGPASTPVPPACPLPHAEVTPSPLTPGQEQFLASLDADQAATLGSLPARERARLLEPHRPGFDRIIAREQARGLAPKPPAAPPPPLPGTTAELWEHLPGAPPDWVVHAEGDLVRDFDDPKYRPAYRQLAEAVWNGTIDAWRVVDAHRQAMNPASRNRGAVFNHALKAHQVLWEGSRPGG
jgi:hypothetical protein